MKQKKTIISVLVVVLSVTLACQRVLNPELFITPEPSATPPTLIKPTLSAQHEYQIGDIISIDDHVLVVLGWENIPASDYNRPIAGNKFIAVELIVVNNSLSNLSLSALMQAGLKDSSGQAYPANVLAGLAAGGNLGGDLPPKEKIRGKIGFQIPVDAQGLQFIFSPNFLQADRSVSVNLGSEPVMVEPPVIFSDAALPATPQVEPTMQTLPTLPAASTLRAPGQTYQIGDVVDTGALSFVVNGVQESAGSQVIKPLAGHKFIILDLTFENKSEKELILSTILQMALQDTSGQKYDVNILALVAVDGKQLDGNLAPHATLRGQVGFEVPEGAADLFFVFRPDIIGTNEFIIALP